MKLKLILLASIFALGLAFNANAGSVADADSDDVPDVFDNCSAFANGPTSGIGNQIDSNQDGYGNACDTDYDQNNATTVTDFGIFFDSFTDSPNDPDCDHNGDGDTTSIDFGTFFADFNTNPPGPSGLACAGTIPCTP